MTPADSMLPADCHSLGAPASPSGSTLQPPAAASASIPSAAVTQSTVTLPAGTLVHVNGMPFELRTDTVVHGMEANLDLALRPRLRCKTAACENCDDTGDVHSRDGEWRGRCFCPAGAYASCERATGAAT